MGVLYISLNYVHVCVFVCGHVPMCAGDCGDQRYQIPLDTELKAGCELPDMGAGNCGSYVSAISLAPCLNV